MKLLANLLCTIFCHPVMILQGQKVISVAAPSGAIVFSFKMNNGSPFYSVDYKGRHIVDYSRLGLQFEDAAFGKNLTAGKPVFRDTAERYELLTGKTKQVYSHYKEVTIPLREGTAASRQINMIVRAFDDGIAFRYSIPKQNNWSSYTLMEENTEFRLSGDPVARCLFLPGYTSSHEGLYSTLPVSKIVPDTLMDMPALFDFGDTYLAITEAALLDYAGMYLSRHQGALQCRLSPLPDHPGTKVKAVLPHQSPWRVLMISDRIGALVESNILTSLNEPCKLKDTGWIKPGKTTFPWWNGNVVPDTLNAPGNNFVTARYYIDFCARNQIAYHSVVEYGLHQWYVDDGVGFQPGPHSDVTTAVPGLDMKEICDYAASKGVGIRVWVHWAALYPKLDKAFEQFEKWGLKGMMIDFMDRDDQEMVNMQTDMLEKAAAHHLHVQFHGAYKPTGLNRTYPNEFTREGTLNYEADKWNPAGISPDHDIYIPFTRMLAGSTDYHLGGFRAVPKDSFKAQYTRPLMLGTRCHMLAMYVVLENYLQMVCDYPAAYEGQDGFEFIKTIPTTWDETKVPAAKTGEYIAIARRNNNNWFVGAINNHQSRQINISLDFLAEGKYHATIYTDAGDTDMRPNHLTKQIKECTNKDQLLLSMAAGGGLAISFTRSVPE